MSAGLSSFGFLYWSGVHALQYEQQCISAEYNKNKHIFVGLQIHIFSALHLAKIALYENLEF